MNSVIINGPPNKGKDLTPTPLPLTRSTVVSGEPHRKDAARRELNRRAARGHGH